MTEFVKTNKDDLILWAYDETEIGPQYFKFEGEDKVYNLWEDYPWALSDEQLEIFNREVPFWANFFKNRKKNRQKPESADNG